MRCAGKGNPATVVGPNVVVPGVLFPVQGTPATTTGLGGVTGTHGIPEGSAVSGMGAPSEDSQEIVYLPLKGPASPHTSTHTTAQKPSLFSPSEDWVKRLSQHPLDFKDKDLLTPKGQVLDAFDRARINPADPAVAGLTEDQRMTLAIIALRNNGNARKLVEQVAAGRIGAPDFGRLLDDFEALIIHDVDIGAFFRPTEFVAEGPLLSADPAVVSGAVHEAATLAHATIPLAAANGYRTLSASRTMDAKAAAQLRLLAPIVQEVFAAAQQAYPKDTTLTPKAFQAVLAEYTRTVQFDAIMQTPAGGPGWIEEFKSANGSDPFGTTTTRGAPVRWDIFVKRQLQILKQLAYAKAYGFQAVVVRVSSTVPLNEAWLDRMMRAARTLGIAFAVEVEHPWTGMRTTHGDIGWTPISHGPLLVTIDPSSNLRQLSGSLEATGVGLFEEVLQECELHFKDHPRATPMQRHLLQKWKVQLYAKHYELLAAYERNTSPAFRKWRAQVNDVVLSLMIAIEDSDVSMFPAQRRIDVLSKIAIAAIAEIDALLAEQDAAAASSRPAAQPRAAARH